jgi:hypothetical protein
MGIYAVYNVDRDWDPLKIKTLSTLIASYLFGLQIVARALCCLFFPLFCFVFYFVHPQSTQSSTPSRFTGFLQSH